MGIDQAIGRKFATTIIMTDNSISGKGSPGRLANLSAAETPVRGVCAMIDGIQLHSHAGYFGIPIQRRFAQHPLQALASPSKWNQIGNHEGRSNRCSGEDRNPP
jgi:hypothetical protein